MRTAPLLLALAALVPGAAAEQMVTKVLDDLEVGTWPASPWNNLTVTATLADDIAQELTGRSQHAMRLHASFTGGEFQHGTLDAPAGLAIPGTLRTVRLYWRGDSHGAADYPLVVNFADGWGRGEVDGRKLEWNLGSSATTAWTKAEFRIPANWKQPVRIQGLTTHNWNHQKVAANPEFFIDRIEVDTDLAGVDERTGLPPGFVPDPARQGKPGALPAPIAMFSADLIGSQPDAEVFNGLVANYRFTARSWRTEPVVGTLHWTLSELADGVTAHPFTQGEREVTVESVADVPLDLTVPRFGLWRLSATVTWKDGSETRVERTFGCLPPQPALSDRDKDASPWGINVHGGHDTFLPAPFRRAGVVWFRDYAFNFDWLERAKGDDKQYRGWPFYPSLIAKYETCGARILPVLASAIKKPGTADGQGRAWRSALADIFSAFPRIGAWEMDNEFDGMWKAGARTDASAGWPAMRAAHKAFAELVEATGGGELLSVQNGDAGIHPERVRAMIASGDFAEVKVINGHHYCGVDAPEENVANQNTGGEGEGADSRTFHDRLTDLVAAAGVDQRRRQVWLTEFGWDTRIGKVVTPFEQACFLQRGFLLTLHAGIDKSFWYWWQDGEKAALFFDGCGLLDYRRQPKLALAAFGAMTAFLPSPKVLGTIEAGPGTFGYLLRQGDQRIAAIWSLDRDAGPTITVDSGELHDMLGNPLPGRRATLSRAPLWITGVAADDRFVRQATYDLDSPWLMTVSAGDPLAVKVRVRGGSNGTIALETPAEWQAAPAPATAVHVAAESEQVVTVRADVPAHLAPGDYRVPVNVTEQGRLKQLQVRVNVRPALALSVSRLSGEPGPATVAVTIANRSTRAIGGSLRAQVPSAWTVDAAAQAVPEIAPGASTTLTLPLQWTAAWESSEEARVEVTGNDGAKVATGIIPGAFTIPYLATLNPDGDLGEWPAASRIPDWCLDRSGLASGAEIRLGWSEAGLAVAVQVAQTSLLNTTPAAFWHCDALEILLDHRPRGAPRPAGAGERMFWLVPQPATAAVFIGQWKRGTEITATRNGIAEATGSSRLVGDGYALEALLPASLVPDITFVGGTRLSGLLMLAIRGKPEHSEVGWPATKAHGSSNGNSNGGPETWPLLILGKK